MKKMMWLTSYAAALGLGLVWGGYDQSSDQKQEDKTSAAKSDRSLRASRKVSPQDVLNEMATERTNALSRYEKLKNSLPVASDHENAVRQALAQLPAFMDPPSGNFDKGLLKWEAVDFHHQLAGEDGKRAAEFEIRVLHWLKDDREACVKFLETNLKTPLAKHILRETVLVDYAMGENLQDVAPWLIQNFKPSMGVLLRQKLKEGAGFKIIQQAIDLGLPPSGVMKAFRNVPFTDRESILAFVVEHQESAKLGRAMGDFLNQESHNTDEVLAWVKKAWDSEVIPEQKRKFMGRIFGEWLHRNETSRSKWGREFLVETKQTHFISSQNNSTSNPIKKLLNTGRDFRFEFRHGRVNANEVLKKLRAELPADHDEAAARKEVFYQLVAEDPKRALELWSEVDDQEKKQAIISSTLTPFSGDNPELLQSYIEQLPGEWTPREADRLLFCWAEHSDLNMERYGENYLDWMFTLPEEERRSKVYTPQSKSRKILERHTSWRIDTSFPHLIGEFNRRVEESKKSKE